ncbi:MAG: GNAT family N-acetyltransferase [Deltaproteobacteria bacterium]|nr:GNAT family N-acetyltransferase [Deltaproteobacteria bacterium]
MIKDYPKTVVTKDGTIVRLRPVVREDEEALKVFFAQVPEEEKWFLRENLNDPEFLKRWMNKLDYDQMFPIVAVKEDDGAILAGITLYRSASPAIRHVVHLRIMVHPEYRSLRLGSWLILDSVKLSMDLGVEKVIAEFVAGVEDAAGAAAAKLDFHQEGVLHDYVKDQQGNYRDLIIMVKNLHQDWSDF